MPGASGTLDLAEQLFRELYEETGLRASDLNDNPRPWAVLDDAKSHVVDIVFDLRQIQGIRKSSFTFRTQAPTVKRETTLAAHPFS